MDCLAFPLCLIDNHISTTTHDSMCAPFFNQDNFFLLRCHFVNVSSKPKLIMTKTLKCFSYAIIHWEPKFAFYMVGYMPKLTMTKTLKWFSYAIIHWEPKFAFYMVGYMHTITRKHARHQIIASYSCLLSFENNYLEQSTHYKSWSILDKTVFFKNELKERLRLAELQTGHFQRSHNNPKWRILKILMTLGT